MLLTKLANAEIVDFLRTVTIKNDYFASQMLKHLTFERYREFLTTEQHPYYLHATGEYILPNAVHCKVVDPITKEEIEYVYGGNPDENKLGRDTVTLKDETGLGEIDILKKLIYTRFDELIYVTSIDTGTVIPFTKEVLYGGEVVCYKNGVYYKQELHAHRKTLLAYKIPGRYFNALCKQYPKYVDLIKAIVYFGLGTDISTAKQLEATPHLSLVSYDSSLLEERERDNIVNTVIGFLDVVKAKWDTKEYAYEDHYAGVFWSAIWAMLPLVIHAKRYENIGTYDVHSTNVWNQLTSSGLSSYRGYLRTEQEWFLYKNIQYMRNRGGQQKVLNLLVDNILNDYRLTIHNKNLVLDTSDSLKETERPLPEAQCAYCARSAYCKKMITTYECGDFLGTKNTCKAKPVIIGEIIHGANRDKIIQKLVDVLNISETEAAQRYERSLMWRDDVVDRIALEVNKNQIIDVSRDQETIGEIFDREVKAGIEPVNSDGVIDRQTNQLRESVPTNTPTKLLEITELEGSTKFIHLFSKFITNTLMHLTIDLNKMLHVNTSYKIIVGDARYSFKFTFKEAVAALYFGMMQENLLDTSLDEVETIEEDPGGGTTTHPVIRKRFLTNNRETPTLDIKIPTRAYLDTTFKLGIPVSEEMVTTAFLKYEKEKYYVDNPSITGASSLEYDLFYEKKERYESISGFTGEDIYHLEINDLVYAVQKDTSVAWDKMLHGFTLLGYIYRGMWYGKNQDGSPSDFDDELTLIPKYFSHDSAPKFKETEDTTRDLSKTYYRRENIYGIGYNYIKDDDVIFMSGVTYYEKLDTHEPTRIPDSTDNYSDEDNKDAYKEIVSGQEMLQLSRYVDLDYVTKLYAEGLHPGMEQEDLAKYLDAMFSLVIYLECLMNTSGDIRTQEAVAALVRCLKKPAGVTDLNLVTLDDDSRELTYEDWLATNKNLDSSFRSVMNADNPIKLWNEFNVKLLDAILTGCKSMYANVGTDDNRYLKLKELVTSLSSYMSAFISKKAVADGYMEHPVVMFDSEETEIEVTNHIHLDTVGELRIELFPHNVNDDKELKTLLGLSDEILEVSRINGVWMYRYGVSNAGTRRIETFPTDNNVDETEEVAVLDSVRALGYKTKEYRYYRTDPAMIISWSDYFVSDELTTYMNNKTISVEMEASNEVAMPDVVVESQS